RLRKTSAQEATEATSSSSITNLTSRLAPMIRLAMERSVCIRNPLKHLIRHRRRGHASQVDAADADGGYAQGLAVALDALPAGEARPPAAQRLHGGRELVVEACGTQELDVGAADHEADAVAPRERALREAERA